MELILSQLRWIYTLCGVNQLCWTAQNTARSDKSVRWAANPTNPTNPQGEKGREMCEPSKVIFPKIFLFENFDGNFPPKFFCVDNFNGNTCSCPPGRCSAHWLWYVLEEFSLLLILIRIIGCENVPGSSSFDIAIIQKILLDQLEGGARKVSTSTRSNFALVFGENLYSSAWPFWERTGWKDKVVKRGKNLFFVEINIHKIQCFHWSADIGEWHFRQHCR